MALDPDKLAALAKFIVDAHKLDEFYGPGGGLESDDEMVVPTVVPLGDGSLMLIDPEIHRPFAVVVPWETYSKAMEKHGLPALRPAIEWQKVEARKKQAAERGDSPPDRGHKKPARKHRKITAPSGPKPVKGPGRNPLHPEVISAIHQFWRENPAISQRAAAVEFGRRTGYEIHFMSMWKYMPDDVAELRRGAGINRGRRTPEVLERMGRAETGGDDL